MPARSGAIAAGKPRRLIMLVMRSDPFAKQRRPRTLLTHALRPAASARHSCAAAAAGLTIPACSNTVWIIIIIVSISNIIIIVIIIVIIILQCPPARARFA